MFKLAIININVDRRSVIESASLPTACPDTRATPTTPTKPLGSRVSPDTACPHKAGIFDGRLMSDLTLCTKKSLVTIAEFFTDVTRSERFSPTSLMIPRTKRSVPSIVSSFAEAVIISCSPPRSINKVRGAPLELRIT